MSWNLLSKAPNINLGYSYYPAVWEDSGKIYVKAQGELDVNVYDVALGTWTAYNLASTNYYNESGSPDGINRYVQSRACRHELIWISNGYLYHLYMGYVGNLGAPYFWPFVDKYLLSNWSRVSGGRISGDPLGTGVSFTDANGNWGRNRHKSVIKEPVSSRIFLINFYTKQIFEWVAATNAYTLVKTWTESIGGNNTESITGCDAVAMNGKIYLLGKHGYNSTGGATSGPVEIDISITGFPSTTLAAYPDYANQGQYTYNFYCDVQWCAIGNSIIGYGGRIMSGTTADGSGTNEALGNCLRRLEFSPGSNAWSDLGTITTSYLYASAVPYNNVGYLFGGYLNGSASQTTSELIFLLDPITSFTLTYDPADGAVLITWVDTTGQALTGYLVERREQQGSVWATVGSGAAATRSVRDTTALSDHDYYYRVRPYYVQV